MPNTPLVDMLVKKTPLLLFLACVGSLGFAFFVEYVLGHSPCILCLYQRIPYAVAAPAALAAIVMKRWRMPLLLICVAAFLGGAGTAAFHVGVEQHWWAGTTSCTGAAFDPNMTLEQLRAQIYAAPVVRCDQVSFSMLGLSMTAWNLVWSLALAGGTLYSLSLRRKMMSA